MEWINTKKQKPTQGQVILITNYVGLNPKHKRYFVVALFDKGEFVEPETRAIFFEPDYWCEIISPVETFETEDFYPSDFYPSGNEPTVKEIEDIILKS